MHRSNGARLFDVIWYACVYVGSSPTSEGQRRTARGANKEKEVIDSLPVGNRARRAPDGGHPRELPRGGGRADQDDGGSSAAFARETRPESEGSQGWVKPE